jgi:RNA polymerase sigma-70 factor (ECF subfamily)
MEISMKQIAGSVGFFGTVKPLVAQRAANEVLTPKAVEPANENDVDNELVAQFVAGDQAAFNSIVCRHKTRIYNFIYFQINQKQADAEDLTQDVFLELYRQADNYRQEAKFSTYLFSVSRNIVLNYFRSNRRRHSDKMDSICQMDCDESTANYFANELVSPDCPATAVIDNDLTQKVSTAITQLNSDERQLLLLTDREGFSYEQIGNILAIKTGTVRSRLNKARQRLMQFIKVNDNEM